MYTEPKALTGFRKSSIICKEFSNWLGIYSLDYPSSGKQYAVWLLYCTPVVNQVGNLTYMAAHEQSELGLCLGHITDSTV